MARQVAMLVWLEQFLVRYPELALFLVISAGYWIGSFKLGAFNFAPTSGLAAPSPACCSRSRILRRGARAWRGYSAFGRACRNFQELGVSPNQRRKACVKAANSEKPSASATSDTEASV